MDFFDFIMCLMRLARLYHEHGQTNLGFQVYNLVHIAIIESATKSRASIIRASERLRRYYTSPICKWESESLYRADIRSLLEPVSAKRQAPRPLLPSKKRRAYPGAYDKSENASSSDICTYWEAGRPCKFEPHCRFKHTCTACGKVEIHNPKTCKLRAISSKQQRL